MEHKKIAIIGLGLIGGSIARALKERCGITDIAAVNRNPESLEQAISDGTISQGFNEIDKYIYDSDIIFLCTPVKKTIEFLEILAPKVKKECIITDVGSTKNDIVTYVNNMVNPPVFIGGHPMAGTEKNGYKASFSHLFENAYYILSPCKSTTRESIDIMVQIIKSIGGIPVVIEACEHDRITGSISHVPHIIASSLVNMVKESDSPEGKMRMLAAGGFKDITRIASSSPEMWENIVTSNSNEIEGILDKFINILNKFKELMKKNDRAGINNFFDSAKQYRDLFSESSKGLIIPVYKIIVDVIDKPGIIGEIATILGKNRINIKNINVSNNREFEQGCLVITLTDTESAYAAFDLLNNNGYKVYRNT
ncbi:MAG: prephenate dehydrogenase [Bacillota bacterium]|nr:prephenate dehydrogenase [Bacillota bacterium]